MQWAHVKAATVAVAVTSKVPTANSFKKQAGFCEHEFKDVMKQGCSVLLLLPCLPWFEGATATIT